MSGKTINLFGDIAVICWGELKNGDNIKKLCRNVVEGQSEEWQSEQQFFEKTLGEINADYYLLLRSSHVLLEPQKYFIDCLSVLSLIPQISFVYCDYHSGKTEVFLPSFKPYVNIVTLKNLPIFVKKNCKSLKIETKKDDSFLKDYLAVLNSNKIGHHLASRYFYIYE